MAYGESNGHETDMLARAWLLVCTPWAIKTCHFIWDHNSHVSWWIFTLLVPYQWKQEKNTPSGNYKICNFTTIYQCLCSDSSCLDTI